MTRISLAFQIVCVTGAIFIHLIEKFCRSDRLVCVKEFSLYLDISLGNFYLLDESNYLL